MPNTTSNLPEELIIKVLPAIITGGVALVVFITGRIFDSYIKKKERILNWYFKTTVEPNLSKVDDSITTLSDFFIESRETILGTPTEKLFNVKFKIFGEYDLILRNLRIELFSLVEISHPELMEEIVTIFDDFDRFKELLDNNESLKSEDCVNQFKNSLTLDFKSKIYKALYKPIVKKNDNGII